MQQYRTKNEKKKKHAEITFNDEITYRNARVKTTEKKIRECTVKRA